METCRSGEKRKANNERSKRPRLPVEPRAARWRGGHADAGTGAHRRQQPLSRGEAMRKLWDYIKKHDLQDPQNRRMFRADDNLRPIFDGNEKLSMFEMTAFVSKHLLK